MSLMLSKLPRVFFSKRSDIWRFMSTSTSRGAKFSIGQGGRLQLNFQKVEATINLTTQWIDSCYIAIHRQRVGSTHVDSDNLGVSGSQGLGDGYLRSIGLALMVDEAHRQLTLVHDERTGERGRYIIEAAVPELFSLDLTLARGSVSLANKMKGACRICLEEGNIEAGIIRGEDILLSTSCGSVHVDELEGRVQISATTDVSARLINGSKVQIKAGGDDASIKIGGLYSSGAQISSTGSVTVSTSHGLISVNTEGSRGTVTLSSVNGAVKVSTGHGDARVHLDALEDGTSNYVRSDAGNIYLSASQEVQTNLDIKGNFDKLPSSFEGHSEPRKAVSTIARAIETSPACSISDQGRGKINLTGARDQSLRQFFNESTIGSPPMLSVSSGGSIELQTLSWADNIVKKFTHDTDEGNQWNR